MSDLFHENVTDEMRDKIFAVMATATHHDFQVLTKRPERMLEYLSASYRRHELQLAIDRIMPRGKMPKGFYAATDGTVKPHTSWPLPNVRLGVSVENQKAADDRLDYLCELASHGWQTMVSFEPLLSPVDPGSWWLSLGARTWVIVGGESGAGARPMHPDWARSLRDQCKAAGVPFFFKQWGEWLPLSDYDPFVHGMKADKYSHEFAWRAGTKNESELPLSCYRVGTKAAGCLLDGVEHHEFPEVR
jgi:hypothetical protein